MAEETFLTVLEAAVLLGISRQRVNQLASKGRLSHETKFGRKLFRRADVEKFAQLDRPSGNPNLRRAIKEG
jgi:excisionase family DNA binding protein